MYYKLCLLFIILLIINVICSEDIRGHMKPLGYHRDAETDLIELNEFPNFNDLHNNYVLTSRPAVFRGAAKTWPAIKKWSDDYFKNVAGKDKMIVEKAKKETRTAGQDMMTMSQFINKYRNDDIYLLGSLSNELLKDVQLPKNYRSIMRVPTTPTLWISSGDTKSLLHRDGEENINCAVDGSKHWVLVDKKYVKEVYESDKYPGYGERAPFDVDAVDLIKWPKFRDVPWYNITLHPGDCLFLPGNWFHHVRSPPGRNIAVNIWWSRPKEGSSLDHGFNSEFIDLSDHKFWSWTRLDGPDGPRYDPLDKETYGMEPPTSSNNNEEEDDDDDDDGWGDDLEVETDNQEVNNNKIDDDIDGWELDDDNDNDDDQGSQPQVYFIPKPQNPNKLFNELWDDDYQQAEKTLPLEPPSKTQKVIRRVHAEISEEAAFVDIKDIKNKLKQQGKSTDRLDDEWGDDDDDEQLDDVDENSSRNNQREDGEEDDDDEQRKRRDDDEDDDEEDNEWDDSFIEDDENDEEREFRSVKDRNRNNNDPGDGLDWDWRKELSSKKKRQNKRSKNRDDERDNERDEDDEDWDN